MTTRKFGRTALIAVLALSIVMSITGGTIAWFTDEVTSENNVIKAGNLDMAVSFKPYGAENTTWTEIEKDTKLFNEDALYEPGYTEAIWLKIENKGNLAFRANAALQIVSEKAGVNKAGESFELSKYLTVKAATTTDVEGWEAFYTTRQSLDNFNFPTPIALNATDLTFAKNLSFIPGVHETTYVLVIVEMPTTVGNEANHNGTDVPEIVLGLSAVATQMPYEEDAFDSSYDADATYPDAVIIDPNAPKAQVSAKNNIVETFTSFDLAKWEMGKEKDYLLEALLTFAATEDDPKADNNKYWHWNADFCVSVDKPVPADVIGLAGKYGDLAFAFDVNSDLVNLIEEGATEVPANTEFRLLAPFDFYVNYQEICTNVKEFICGVYFTENATEEQKAALAGTTMTVKLNLYETVPPYESGNANPEEVVPENCVLVGIYKHTF